MSRRTRTKKAEPDAVSDDAPGDVTMDAEWLEHLADEAHRAIAEVYADAQVLLTSADGKQDGTGSSA